MGYLHKRPVVERRSHREHRCWRSQLTSKSFYFSARYSLNTYQTSRRVFLKNASYLLSRAFLSQSHTPLSAIKQFVWVPHGKCIPLGNMFRLRVISGDTHIISHTKPKLKVKDVFLSPVTLIKTFFTPLNCTAIFFVNRSMLEFHPYFIFMKIQSYTSFAIGWSTLKMWADVFRVLLLQVWIYIQSISIHKMIVPTHRCIKIFTFYGSKFEYLSHPST